ncbi:MAG: DUF4914 family protein [Candidatus Goldiibacteriota bacterium]
MDYKKWTLPPHIRELLSKTEHLIFPKNRNELINIALNGDNMTFDVEFDAGGKIIKEASVCRCKNGVAVNYYDTYMRRRDPESMIVADEKPTNKPVFEKKFKRSFSGVKKETLEWFSGQELIVMPFSTGKENIKYNSLFIGPANCGFFAMAMSDLQKIMPHEDVPEDFKPEIVLYLAPVFRHTHFEGKQVVVHERGDDVYEIFSYNLYPGPSAKKGIYGALLDIGEREGWLTLHSSSVKLITPYENSATFLHEGASGGGKSEMNEYMEHSDDNRMVLGKNTLNNRIIDSPLINECRIFPISDDMSMCHPSYDAGRGKLTVSDAENAWFVRVNHMNSYGVNPHFEKLCIHSEQPLIFLNISATAGATCLLWEHIEDSPGKPCPNPRIIFPRSLVPGVIEGNVEIDYRSFGVRTPPCSAEKPSYGIIGYFHILPPAIAWLWRLVAPRGHDNPSIINTEGMTSEGVGSYGPFLTGSIVKHANLLLEQFERNVNTYNVLFPNQHIGVWDVGFMPQWFVREYLARKGGKRFNRNDVQPARQPLLGYLKNRFKVEEIEVPAYLMDVSLQSEVGGDAYDKGGQILHEFFVKELEKFDKSDLCGKGKKIFQCCLDKGSVSDYEDLLGGI